MASRADHPSRVAGIAVPWAVVFCLVLVLAGCGGTEIRPPAPPANHTDARAAGAAVLLQELRHGLLGHDRAAVQSLAAPDSQSRVAVRDIYDNAVALRLEHLDFRYVDESQGAVDENASAAYGDRAWSADVTTTWRIPVYDPGDSHLDTRFTFVATKAGVRLAAVGGGGERGALWLQGPLHVVRSADALVLVAAEPPARFAALGKQAVVDVRKVLHRWRGRLVIEVPGSEKELEQVLDATTGEYSAIAAVTTTDDGSLVPGTPVHVFVNPKVFDGLGPRGAQVVLSHEATHVATDATFASMPTWLLEGFADFVALAHSDVPLRTAASQVFARVRRQGGPRQLPSTAQLDPSAPGLGARYEEAWTVCRFIGARYGEQKMVAFYDAVDHGSSTQQTFRRVLGTDQRDFVQAWRTNLVALAGGVGG
ncbi:MAG: hypothetical protein ACR2FG_04745 [Marmoricola sp.]